MRPTPGRIRVLVVDDSVVIRRLVAEGLAADPSIEVVGQAANGKMAVEKVIELKPDAITMDIEMPIMNGIEAVRAIRRLPSRVPIVMFSTLTERGASATLDALAAGASDYVTKPSNVGSFQESQRNVRDQLVPKLKALTRTRMAASTSPPPPPTPNLKRRTGPFAILAIGCSTGGPDALATVLPTLPADLSVPVVVVQHMPPVFTKLLAQRLDSQCKLRVTEAVHGETVVPGKVLIAPGGMHMTLKRQGAQVVVALDDGVPENFCKPAVDVLFRSVAGIYADRILGVVLTGMGRDGERGSKLIRDGGGEIIVQDDATSVVWGMPGAVAGAGQADRVLPLGRIGPDVSAALSRSAVPVGVGS